MSRVARLLVDCGYCASVDVRFDFICSSVNLNLQKCKCHHQILYNSFEKILNSHKNKNNTFKSTNLVRQKLHLQQTQISCNLPVTLDAEAC